MIHHYASTRPALYAPTRASSERQKFFGAYVARWKEIHSGFEYIRARKQFPSGYYLWKHGKVGSERIFDAEGILRL